MSTHQNLTIAKCSGNTKTVLKKTGNRVFATSSFAILVGFAFKFWYQPLILIENARQALL